MSLVHITKPDTAFTELVMPVLADMFETPHLTWVGYETSTSQHQRELDRTRSIDGYLRFSPHHLIPVSKRAQQDGNDWGTLTIRSKIASGAPTELHKLCNLAPDHLIIHSYCTTGWADLLAVYVARAVDVANHLEDTERPNSADGNLFKYCTFANIKHLPHAMSWHATPPTIQ